MIQINLTQTDLSVLAHVSRAAVSKWFRSESNWVNVETNTLRTLAHELSLPPDLFLKEISDLAPYTTHFLWDRLYPSMESFVQALVQGRLQAIARLVQMLGFHQSIFVIGKKTVTHFEKYKKYIKPARRKQLEVLWPLYNSQL
ncbi:MAG: hypothetical protein A3I05_08015 [Deltaproteobacteria bacterium RIFCSPLOWO2_02_FULL_44_10]|nr:MAG: hypothetical protein A3C46_01865 [Deltaproteobacteria bacterium RIFCSPHIGHO2_02_FULL_44_16]OGQ45627.1 MAG: hypothetical protein A3I05_08015 [Deltaproteobacteria bacterium RIFCSPLOWO2_02_FULL_44_10]